MSVIVRKVRTALQKEYQKAGGVRIEDAVAQADQNLGALSDACAERIDQALCVIVAMTADPQSQPDVAALRKLHGLVNEMLACCAGVEIEGMVDTLYALGRLVGALMATEAPIEGALTPAVNLLRLVRRGAVASEDVEALLAGLDQCAARVRAHTRIATYS